MKAQNLTESIKEEVGQGTVRIVSISNNISTIAIVQKIILKVCLASSGVSNPHSYVDSFSFSGFCLDKIYGKQKHNAKAMRVHHAE